MDWGMKNRMSRLIQEDGHCFFLPIDHGYFQGPTSCLEKPGETIAPLLPYCRRAVLSPAACCATASTRPETEVPIILRVSGGTSMVGPDLADEGLTTSIEEIIRLNAAAVGVSVFIGTQYEHQTLKNLSELVNKCEDYGIPVMAVTAVGQGDGEARRPLPGACCRICAELGARVVKTYWCKDFDKVARAARCRW